MKAADFRSGFKSLVGIARGEHTPSATELRRIEGRLDVAHPKGGDEHEDEPTGRGLERQHHPFVAGVEIGDGDEPAWRDREKPSGEVSAVDEAAGCRQIHPVMVARREIEVKGMPARGKREFRPRWAEKSTEARADAFDLEHRLRTVDGCVAEECPVDGRPEGARPQPAAMARLQRACEECVEVRVKTRIGGIGVGEIGPDETDVETDEQALKGPPAPGEHRPHKTRAQARRPQVGKDPPQPVWRGAGVGAG